MKRDMDAPLKVYWNAILSKEEKVKMAKISCEVPNCSHNNSGVCHANLVGIVGSSAQKENDTCCSSFLN